MTYPTASPPQTVRATSPKLSIYVSNLARLAPRLAAAIPFIYILLALPTVVSLAMVTPTFEASDEPAHFYRAVQLLQGEMIGRAENKDSAGGFIDSAAVALANDFLFRVLISPTLSNADFERQMRSVFWSVDESRSLASFTNTVIYPPFFYLPAVAGLKLGKRWKLSIVSSVRLARVLMGVACIAGAAIALWLCPRGRAILFVLLSLPMTLHLFSTITQDGLLIVSVAITVALCARALARDRRPHWYEALIAAVLLGAVVAARPLYLPLVALAPLLAMLERRDRPWSLANTALVACPLALALLIGCVWIKFGAASVLVASPIAHASIAGQLHYLVEDPQRVVLVAWNTLNVYGKLHAMQFIGVFGWLDSYLPRALYRLISIALLVALLLCAREVEGEVSKIGLGLVVFIGLLTIALLYGAIYVSWTPVGEARVEGFQGRYLLPVTLLTPLLFLVNRRGREPRSQRPIREGLAGPFQSIAALAWLALIGMVELSNGLLPYFVVHRYYL